MAHPLFPQPAHRFPSVHGVLTYTWDDFKPAAKRLPFVAHTLANHRGRQIYQKSKSNRLGLELSPVAAFPVQAGDLAAVSKPGLLRPKLTAQTRTETPNYIRQKRSVGEFDGLQTALQWTRIEATNSAPRKRSVQRRGKKDGGSSSATCVKMKRGTPG